ncbi:MAG: PAS domain S-box protein [Anaerolineae bacterium]|nr:PAS domain S-box protein [Anaerolineae bacterium]
MSKPSAKTKAQLVAELEAANQHIAELEALKTRYQKAEAALRTSEERYRRITQTLTDYIYTVRIEDGQPVETIHGPACIAVTGYTSEDFAANTDLWLQMVEEEDRPAVLEQAHKILNGQGAQPIEHRITRKDGVKRWVRNTPVLYTDAEGKLLSYDGVIQDITERKQVEKALRESERTLAEAQRVAHVGSWIFYVGSDTIHWSEEERRIFGLDPQGPDLALADVLARVHPDDRERAGENIRKGLAGEAPYEFQSRIIWPDGQIRHIQTRAEVYRDEQGNPIRVVGTTADITEKREAERALRESEKKFRQIVETSPMGIHMYRLDPDGRLVFIGANPAADRILGVDNSQFVGKTIEEAFPALTETEVPERYRLAAAKGEPWQTDQITYEENQIVGAFEVHAFQTSPNHMAAMFLDITEQKRAEDALRESEATLRSIVRAAPVGIGLVVKRVILQVNARICEMTGYGRDELVGQDSRILYLSGEEYDYVGQKKRQQIEKQGTGSVETRWQRKDGTIIQILLNATPLNPDNLSDGVTFTALDITERKLAQEALAQERNLLRTLIDSMPDHIYAKDTEGRFTLKNEADALAMGASSTSEAIGKTDFDYYPRKFAERFQADDQQVIRSGKPLINHEEPNIDAKGNKRWVLTTKVPLRDGQGEIVGLVGIGRDITERKQVEEELERHQEHLEELVEQRTAELKAANEQLLVLSHVKDEFVSNVSHELRTPISSIKLRQHLAKKNPEQLEEHLNVIKRETDRLARTIEDLLQLSRLDQQRKELYPAAVDINQLVKQYIADRVPIASDKHLILSFQEEPDLPNVTADASLLEQALSILLTNAINYTPANGKVTIRTHARQDEDGRWAGFSISDTGPGIPPEEQSQLFTRFFRGMAGLKSGVPGTGLGLAIAQEIVNQHDGEIEVESNGIPGQGATFSVWIPIQEKTDDKAADSR